MLPKLHFAEYYGRTLRQVESAEFSLAEVAYSPGARLRAHAHENAIFSFHLAGECTERVGRQQWSLEPLTLRYHPPDEVHADRVGARGWRILSIEFTGAAFRRLYDRQLVPSEPVMLLDAELMAFGHRLNAELRAADDVSGASIEALVLDVAAKAAQRAAPVVRNGRPPAWLLGAEELLRARFRQPLVLSDIAYETGVHPVHLARVFHRVFGQTMGDYVRARRIEFACRSMREAAAPLSTIARAAGFADQSHFCRTFRRLIGMTPSQYRALLVA
jgi:AraC family transcriptional regulator